MAKAWQTNGRHMQEKVLKEEAVRALRQVGEGEGGGEIHTCWAHTLVSWLETEIHTHTPAHTLAITNGKLVCKQSEKGNWQMKPNLAKHTRTHWHMKRFPQATLGLKQNRYET